MFKAMYLSSRSAVIGPHHRVPTESMTWSELLCRVAPLFGGHGKEGVLLLDISAARKVGLPVREHDAETAELPDPGPWKIGGSRRRDWITASRNRSSTIHVGVIPLIDRDECPFIDAPDPRAAVAAFTRWHEVTGRAWHMTATASGLSILRDTWPRDRQAPTPKPPAVDGPVGESPYDPDDWCGLHANVESRWDLTRAYIGAAGVVQVAAWGLKPGPRRFDPALAGWWQVRLGPWAESRMPNPAGYGPWPVRWVTSPTLALLDDLRESGRPFVDYEVLASRVSPGRPLLKGWAARMRQAYDATGDDPMVRAMVKTVGRRTLGVLARETNWCYRPDWWHAIIAQHRSNLWRRMWVAGVTEGCWPISIETDAVWYAGLRPPSSFRVWGPDGRVLDQLGTWKPKGTRDGRKVPA